MSKPITPAKAAALEGTATAALEAKRVACNAYEAAYDAMAKACRALERKVDVLRVAGITKNKAIRAADRATAKAAAAREPDPT